MNTTRIEVPKVRYLRQITDRGRTYWRYRRVVPPAMRDTVAKVAAGARTGTPRQAWVRTWAPGTPYSDVEREARRLAVEHDRAIALWRAQGDATLIEQAEQQAREHLRTVSAAQRYETMAYLAEPFAEGGKLKPGDAAFLNALEHGGTFKPAGLPLSAAYKLDRERAEGAGRDRDEKPIALAVDSFIGIVGDRDVTRITADDFTIWRQTVLTKGWRANGKARPWTPSTAERRRNALAALLRRAHKAMAYSGANAFAGETIHDGKGSDTDVLPFNRAMLEAIDRHLTTSTRVRHESRNLLKIMKCTGAGPAEVAGLAIADVDLDSDIPSIWIRANKFRGLKVPGKRNKKSARDRVVPLVGDALDAMRDAMRRAKGRKDGKLFEGFDGDANSISAKLCKVVRAAGVPKSRRLVPYSYRHTLKQGLRDASVPEYIQNRIEGHAGKGVADNYGAPDANLRQARDAILAALPHLGNVDRRRYRDDEWMEPKAAKLTNIKCPVAH